MTHRPARLLLALVLPGGLLAAQPAGMLRELPPAAVARLAESLDHASAHSRHLWRDTPPVNPDGTVNAYVEIPRGERRKWEFDMRTNARAVDRVMPPEVGGYPVNYGFVPQTIAPDGDPFDALVLGPPLEGGSLVRGVIVGLMEMEDEKGADSKVVLSVPDGRGRARLALTPEDRERIGSFFRTYKDHETGKFSKVPGWGSEADGRAHVDATHAFFRECRQVTDAPCRPAISDRVEFQNLPPDRVEFRRIAPSRSGIPPCRSILPITSEPGRRSRPPIID